MHLAELVVQGHEEAQQLGGQRRFKLIVAGPGLVLKQGRTGAKPIGRLEQMGFAGAVLANDYVDFWRELQC